MTTTEDSTDSLWNQSVCSKSWFDLMEEEEKLSESLGQKKAPLLRDSTNTNHADFKLTVKSEPLEDESARDITISYESKDIKVQPSEVLPNFSVSHTLNSEVNSKENASQNCLTEQPKDFLHDDLSLTSHLNGFQLVSPCKVDQKTPTKVSSKSSFGAHLSDKKDAISPLGQVTKRKLQTGNEIESMTDEMLMPSPSKIRRQATPTKRPLHHTPKQKSRTPKQQLTPNFLSYTPNHLNRKRSRDSTPGSSEKKWEQETDPEVLARRQKQIDYGKNTIGYDRYRQLVPKEARSKMHPKTPPLHVKFSRRAWDGMIKAWRQRLHFWDPPSEGGGNPQCLESDETSETSSTDGSLPATPVQDRKRQCWKKTPSNANYKGAKGAKSELLQDEEDDNQGCTPLPPEE